MTAGDVELPSAGGVQLPPASSGGLTVSVRGIRAKVSITPS